MRMAEVNFLARMEKECKRLPVIDKTMPRGTKLTWGHGKSYCDFNLCLNDRLLCLFPAIQNEHALANAQVHLMMNLCHAAAHCPCALPMSLPLEEADMRNTIKLFHDWFNRALPGEVADLVRAHLDQLPVRSLYV